MLPWMFMPGIESGRSRRRRESSSDSRRRRRDRRRRDRTRSRERSRGRSPRSRRSEASSHLPVAEPGYRWCQIPETVLHGGTGPAVAQAPLPPPPTPPVQKWPQQQRGAQVEASSSWQRKHWQPPQKTWGQQTWSQRGSGSSGKWNQGWGQQREKGWNKWPKKDEGRDWAKPDPKDKPPEGGEVFAAAPAAPGGDPYQVAEATKEEIEAAAARQAEREEEGFHAHLWQEAAQQALADPDRPLCARELVKNGRLTAWWSMSWKDAWWMSTVTSSGVTLWAPRMDPGCCLSRSWRGALASSPGSSKTTGQSFKLKGELLRAASSRFLARWWSFSQPPYTAPPTRSQPTTATH